MAVWICIALSIFDFALGGVAVWQPKLYARIFHPGLADVPVDFIARTGMTWLFFGVVEAIAAWKRKPLWFFAVGLLRLMDVPADVAYATLARGASLMSRSAIFFAPLFNLAVGIYLVSRIRTETTPRPAGSGAPSSSGPPPLGGPR